MFLVLIIWFQPIKHLLACWSSPLTCYKILFWWSGNWHRLETIHFSCNGDWTSERTIWFKTIGSMCPIMIIYVPNAIDDPVETPFIYIYNACYIVFLWLKWLGISSPSEVNTIINTVLRNWGQWNLVYLVFWKCLRFNDDDGLRHWVYYIIHYWICHDLPQSSPWFGIPIIDQLPESCWWVTSTSRNKSPNVEYCSSS